MCRVSTGQSFSTRTLHTDEDESIFAVKRPIIINGIEELATRGDLVDRSMIIDLPRIPANQRRTEQEFWTGFNEAHSRILGGLLDAASSALAHVNDVNAAELPRMSDFARWVTAAESHLGWHPGTLVKAYRRNKQDAELGVLEASPVAAAVNRFPWRTLERDSYAVAGAVVRSGHDHGSSASRMAAHGASTRQRTQSPSA